MRCMGGLSQGGKNTQRCYVHTQKDEKEGGRPGIKRICSPFRKWSNILIVPILCFLKIFSFFFFLSQTFRHEHRNLPGRKRIGMLSVSNTTTIPTFMSVKKIITRNNVFEKENLYDCSRKCKIKVLGLVSPGVSFLFFFIPRTYLFCVAAHKEPKLEFS